MTQPDQPTMELSLLGGPLHRLGIRLGLVKNWTNTIALGMAIGLFLWGVLVALAFICGVGEDLFTLTLIGGHVRLLLVIPLLFVCESVLDPRVTEFSRFLVQWHLVPDEQRSRFDTLIRRANRMQRNWLLEAILVVVAVAGSFGAMHLHLGGNSSGFYPNAAPAGSAPVIWWYSVVCLTVFRFLAFRWAWRLCVWALFLWRVSRFRLRLVPTHPDTAGGLGFLEVVHTHFVPLIFALSALKAATFAEELSTGATAFEAIYVQMGIMLAVNAVLFLGPLLVFADKLWNCRVQGLDRYMGLAERYVRQFDRKWMGTPAPEEPLLGTPDIQSLADLSTGVDIVRDMRTVPISIRLLLAFAAATLAPMAPLLLIKYPIAELTKKLFTGLVGL